MTKLEPLHTACGNAVEVLCNTNSLAGPQRLNIELPYNPEILILTYIQKRNEKTGPDKNLYTMFIAAMFTMASKLK